MKTNFDQAVSLLKAGKTGVLPTDTIYGIHASAFNKTATERIYKLRGRDLNKPFIILIAGISDLQKFNIQTTSEQQEILHKLWPNPISVILPCKEGNLYYLHRGTKQLAFRNPRHQKLLKLLAATGPLISTSVNKQGEKPAETIAEAQKTFGDTVDFYVDSGKLTSEPSTLIAFKNGEVKILREGAHKYKNH